MTYFNSTSTSSNRNEKQKGGKKYVFSESPLHDWLKNWFLMSVGVV